MVEGLEFTALQGEVEVKMQLEMQEVMEVMGAQDLQPVMVELEIMGLGPLGVQVEQATVVAAALLEVHQM